jgi:4-hydroxybenzoate polyprenyltransferase
VRWKDSVLLQIFTVLGVLSSDRNQILTDPIPGLLVIIATTLLYIYTFTSNDLYNIKEDSADPRKKNQTFLSRGISVKTMRIIVNSIGFIAFLVFLFTSWTTQLAAIFIVIASLLYSHPRFNFKRVIVISSLLHIFAGAAQFWIGFSAYLPADRILAIGCLYCGLLLAAGHLVQEVEDHEGDQRSSIITLSVYLGKVVTLRLALCLFLMSYILIAILIFTAKIEPWALVILGFAIPIWKAFSKVFLTSQEITDIQALRQSYQISYVLQLIILAAVLWNS